MNISRILFPLILSGMMSWLISGMSTFKALGFNHHFFSLWMSAWLVSWVLAFPSVMLCAPLAQKLVKLILGKSSTL